MMKHYNSEITSPASLFSRSPHPEMIEELKGEGSELLYGGSNRNNMVFYRNVSPNSPSSANNPNGDLPQHNMNSSNNNPIVTTTTSRNLRDIYYQYEFLQNNGGPGAGGGGPILELPIEEEIK